MKTGGYAVVGVVIASLILFALTAAALQVAVNNSLNVRDETAMMQSLYAAEAGIRKFAVELTYLPDTHLWTTAIWSGFEEYPVGDSRVISISAEDQGGSVAVVSIGGYGSAVKTLVADVRKPLLRGLTVGNTWHLGGETLVDSDVFVDGDLVVSGNAEVRGTIWTDGDVFLEDRAAVDGGVHASGIISVDGGASVKGTLDQYAETKSLSFPPVELEHYRELARNEGHFFSTSRQFSFGDVGELDGIYFVEGDITFAEPTWGYSGTGVFVASGDILLSEGQVLVPQNSSCCLGLISGGEISLGEDSKFGGVLICNGQLAACAGGSLVGVAAARGVSSFEKDFQYQPGLLEFTAGYLGQDVKAGVTSWEEQYPVY